MRDDANEAAGDHSSEERDRGHGNHRVGFRPNAADALAGFAAGPWINVARRLRVRLKLEQALVARLVVVELQAASAGARPLYLNRHAKLAPGIQRVQGEMERNGDVLPLW